MRRFLEPEFTVSSQSQATNAMIEPNRNGITKWRELLAQAAECVAFSPDLAFYVANPDGQIILASPAYYSVQNPTGGQGEFIASHISDFIAAHRESFEQNERVDVKGRRGFAKSCHYPVFGDSKSVIGIFGYYVDTTDQLETLQKITRELDRKNDQVRASSDFFWEIDGEGKIFDLSDRITDVAGRPAVLFVGRALSELGEFVDRAGNATGLPTAIDGRQPFRDTIFRIADEREQERFFHLSGVPFFDTDTGAFAGFRGVGTDVTERFRMEDSAARARSQLEQAREDLTNRNTQLEMERGRAEKALRAKSEFLATMSHELRTPLNAILGFSEAMTMSLFGELNAQYSAYASDILKSGRHLLSLIDSMLDAASIEANELSLTPQPVQLAGLVRKAVSIVQMRANAKNLDLSAANVEEGWIVNADPVPATQIFVNLLSNAVKFTGAGGRIGVDIEAQLDRPSPFAAITFWDTGIGVPEKMQEAIFDKFVRGTNASAYDDVGEGTGIGLHISRRLALLMDGDLKLKSKVGEGSRFTVFLPLVRFPDSN